MAIGTIFATFPVAVAASAGLSFLNGLGIGEALLLYSLSGFLAMSIITAASAMVWED